MKRMGAMLLLLLAPDAPQLEAQSAAPAPRNIILILSDDHRHDFMGFMASAPSFLETPSLDRMAAGGAHIANGDGIGLD